MAPVLFDVVQLVTPYEQFSSSQDKLVVKKKGNVRKKKKIGSLLIQKNCDTMNLWLKWTKKKSKTSYGSHVETTRSLCILEETFEKTVNKKSIWKDSIKKPCIYLMRSGDPFLQMLDYIVLI